MLRPGEQWLVRTDPAVIEQDGTVTDRVLVDCYPPNFEKGDDWPILCTGEVSLFPSVPDAKRRFTKDDWITSHKITVTTREADTSARALVVGIEPVGLSSEAVRHWRRIRLRGECPSA